LQNIQINLRIRELICLFCDVDVPGELIATEVFNLCLSKAKLTI